MFSFGCLVSEIKKQPPDGHDPIRTLGIPADELEYLLERGYSHGRWDGNRLIVSRYVAGF